MALTRVGGGIFKQPIDVGIITATSVNASGIVTAGTVQIGAATTIHTTGIDLGSGNITSHNINSTGIITATSFVGPVTGNVTGNTSGTASNLTGSPSINVTNITASGNVSIAGTLTYEDVTNIDSVGVVTARSGIHVTGGSVGIGLTNPDKDLTIASTRPTIKLIDSDVANNAAFATIDASSHGGILFDADPNDARSSSDFRFNVDGDEKLRITSAGSVGIGTDNPGSPVDIANGDLEFSNKANSSVTQTIKFSDGTQGRGKIQYEHNGDSMVFHTFSTERLRIKSDGKVGINQTSPTAFLHTKSGANDGTVISTFEGATNNKLDIKFISTGPAINVTAGDPLVFEMSGNEKLRIGSDGNLFVAGTAGMNTSQLPNGSTININGTDSNDGFSIIRYNAGYGAYGLNIGRSKSGTLGTNAIVTDGNDIGHITFYGADGATYLKSSMITAQVDGTTSAGSAMPGRLVFKTTPAGSATPEERFRITSEGKLLIGSATGSVHGDRLLQVGKTDRSSTYVSITSSTSGVGGLLFADTTTNDTGGYRGIIDYTHSTDAMRFYTQASEKLRIDSLGNIGVNQTSVNSSRKMEITQPSSYTSGLRINSAGSAGNGAYVEFFVGTANYKIGGDHNTNALLFKKDGTEYMRHDSSGHLQIRREGIGNFSGTDSRHTRYIIKQTNGQEAIAGSVFAQGKSNWGGDLVFASKQATANPSTGLTETMRLDAAGRLKIPYQPTFNAKLSNATGGGFSGFLVFNTVDYNIGSHYNNSNGRFTAPVDGRYLFSWYTNVVRDGGNGSVWGDWYVNTSPRNNRFYTHHSGAWELIGATIILDLNTNDYVRVYVHTAGNYDGSSYGSFSGTLLS